jgi:hypothetical protein
MYANFAFAVIVGAVGADGGVVASVPLFETAFEQLSRQVNTQNPAAAEKQMRK